MAEDKSFNKSGDKKPKAQQKAPLDSAGDAEQVDQSAQAEPAQGGQDKQPQNQQTGPWDVAMYVVQRFPIVAICLLLLGLSFYGLKIILDERHTAIVELDKARTQIAEQQRKADEQTLKAELAVARAEVDALLSVQQTLMNASSQIQTLVASQLESTVRLEEIRKSNIQEMERQVKELDGQRQSAQRELDKANFALRNSRINYAIEDVSSRISNNIYGLTAALESLNEKYSADDQETIDLILQTINSNQEEASLRAALQFALYLKMRDEKWLADFSDTIRQNYHDIEGEFFSAVNFCCETLALSAWGVVMKAASHAIKDENISDEKKFSILSLIDYTPFHEGKYILANQNMRESDEIWDILAFLLDVSLSRLGAGVDLPESRYLYFLLQIDPSSAHAVLYRSLSGDEPMSMLGQDAQSFIDNWRESYPVLAEPPDEALKTFWLQENLIANRSSYDAKRVAQLYAPSTP